VTDPDRVEAQALVQLGGPGMVPVSVRHALLPLEWEVLTVLENGTTPPTGRCPGGRCRPVSS
jgi:hypothetical protein